MAMHAKQPEGCKPPELYPKCPTWYVLMNSLEAAARPNAVGAPWTGSSRMAARGSVKATTPCPGVPGACSGNSTSVRVQVESEPDFIDPQV